MAYDVDESVEPKTLGDFWRVFRRFLHALTRTYKVVGPYVLPQGATQVNHSGRGAVPRLVMPVVVDSAVNPGWIPIVAVRPPITGDYVTIVADLPTTVMLWVVF